MNKRKIVLIQLFLLSGILIWIVFSCGSTRVIRNIHTPDITSTDDPKLKFLKVHMKDGGMYVFDNWVLDYQPDSLWGEGSYYDVDRKEILGQMAISSSSQQLVTQAVIPESEIALLETNSLKNVSGNLSAITIVGVPMAIMSAYCIANPKACFGSCPTFYAWDGENMQLMAEGFSSSILPSFEKKDIDKLYWAKNQNRTFTLKLTNEALETHVIRYADLLVFPVSENEEVFASKKGDFFKVSQINPPVNCIAEEGDCLSLVTKMDHNEWFSEADENNLAEREELEFSFNNLNSGRKGLLISTRQTLMTTYLFYQSMAYTGTLSGYYAARIENGDKGLKNRVRRLWDLLGGIEVFIKTGNKKWIKVDELTEMGPIASDVHLIELPETNDSLVQIKLRLTKGLWRIDYLALAGIDKRVEPIRLKPSEVTDELGKNPEVLAVLHDTIKPLITFPGDKYFLSYVLPEGDNFEFLLESKGYYLEWMRDEWLEEEDMKKAAVMFALPKLYMRMVAPEFKKVEPTMEADFWGSRYVKN